MEFIHFFIGEIKPDASYMSNMSKLKKQQFPKRFLNAKIQTSREIGYYTYSEKFGQRDDKYLE